MDRAFDGRFKNNEGWQFLTQPGGNLKIWNYLEDEFPGQDHKAFKPGTAAAANPVKTYTSHWQTSPKHYIQETCLTCHTEWSEQQAMRTASSSAPLR